MRSASAIGHKTPSARGIADDLLPAPEGDAGGDVRRPVREHAVVAATRRIERGRSRPFVETKVTDEPGFVADEAKVHVLLDLSLRARHVPNTDFVDRSGEVVAQDARADV